MVELSATHDQVIKLLVEGRFRGMSNRAITSYMLKYMGQSNPYHLTQKGAITFTQMLIENGYDWAEKWNEQQKNLETHKKEMEEFIEQRTRGTR